MKHFIIGLVAVAGLLAVGCKVAQVPETKPANKAEEVGVEPDKPRFVGTTGRASTMVFVCGASGSMLGQQFDLLREEIKISVNRLSRVQPFDIVIFKDHGFHALTRAVGSSQLLPATPDNKKKVESFLQEISTGEQSDPIEAMRYVFSLKPNFIFLLTDRGFADNAEVASEIKKLNADGKVKVNTIAFFRQDVEPGDKKLCEEVLAKIAKENGGTFRVVWMEELLKVREEKRREAKSE